MTGIRRILVAVDASPLSLVAVAAAAELARRLDAELNALFVEDINLVRLSAHPEVHTFSLQAARRHQLAEGVIETAMQLQCLTARRALEEAAVRSEVRGTFAVRRGLVDLELLEAAGGADLVCLGWSGRPQPGSRPRLGSVARRLAHAAPSPVMVLRAPGPGQGPVMALWDGSPQGRRVLAVAAALAERDGGMVELLVPLADTLEVTRLEREAVELLSRRGLVARHRSAGPLARCLGKIAATGILVAPADCGLALDDLPCSVVLVR